MKVQAAQGLQCPMEGNPRKYITDREAVEVPETAYYRRLMADGSLVAARTTKQEPSRKSAKSATEGGLTDE
jgi:hypothetical protein